MPGENQGEAGLPFTLLFNFLYSILPKFTDVLKRAVALETEDLSPVSLPLSFFVTFWVLV